MARKPLSWKKLTPAQFDLMERPAADRPVAFAFLEHREFVAFHELKKQNFVEMQTRGRARLKAVLTKVGRGYRTERVLVGVTDPQVALLR